MVAAEGWELIGAQKRREAESESRKAESGKRKAATLTPSAPP